MLIPMRRQMMTTIYNNYFYSCCFITGLTQITCLPQDMMTCSCENITTYYRSDFHRKQCSKKCFSFKSNRIASILNSHFSLQYNSLFQILYGNSGLVFTMTARTCTKLIAGQICIQFTTAV